MANQARETELTHIQTDAAAHSQSSDQQTANRLQLEVNQFLKDHHSPQDMKDLTKSLKAGHLANDEIQRLEKMGFPTPSIGEVPPPHANGRREPMQPAPNRDAHPEAPKATAGAGQPGGEVAQPNSDQSQSTPPKKSFRDVMNEVYQAEGNYNHHAPGDRASAERSMHQALQDVQNYLKTNGGDAQEMIAKLDKNHLLPQLAVVALNEAVKQKEAATGKPIDSLSRQEALQLLSGDQSPLGKALSASLDHSFAPKQADGTTPEGFRGSGYADGGRDARGHESTGSAGPGDQPILTRKHLNDLMEHFDRQPLAPNQQPDLDKDEPNIFTKALRFIGA